MTLRRVSLSALGFLLFLFLAVPPLSATASGTLTVNGKEYALTNGHATPRKDPFDASRSTVFLVFTDQELPAGALFDEFELMKLADRGISGVTVQITEEKNSISGSFFSPGFKKIKQFSATGNQKIEITAMSSDRIAGTISVPPGDFFDEEFAYSVEFDVPIERKPAPVVKGKPLPAGGGDVGKAYEAYRKAVAAGDLPAIRLVVAADLVEATMEPDFPEMLEFIQMMQPKKIRITGGNIDGDNATLEVTSLDEEHTTATVTMQREGGKWKMVKEAWRSGSD
jgi:hypothetical protein